MKSSDVVQFEVGKQYLLFLKYGNYNNYQHVSPDIVLDIKSFRATTVRGDSIFRENGKSYGKIKAYLTDLPESKAQYVDSNANVFRSDSLKDWLVLCDTVAKLSIDKVEEKTVEINGQKSTVYMVWFSITELLEGSFRDRLSDINPIAEEEITKLTYVLKFDEKIAVGDGKEATGYFYNAKGNIIGNMKIE